MKRRIKMKESIAIRALIHYFGDYVSASFRRAILFFTIFNLYISTLNSKSLPKDGFILTSSESLSILTGCTSRDVREDLKYLQEKGLIEKQKTLGTKIKIDANEATLFVETCVSDYLEWKERQISALSDERDEFFESLRTKAEVKKEILDNLDSDKVRDFDYLSSNFRGEDALFIYLFSHYYNAYMHLDYRWSLVGFNTMINTWRGKYQDDDAEYRLSKSLKDAIVDHSRRFFELKWRDKFLSYNGAHDDGVIFDGLMVEES